MTNIILIDDDKSFKELFLLKANQQSKPFNIIYRNSFEGLKELLPKIQRHAICVVLDVKCLMTPDQAMEDEAFISSAITYLDRNCPEFPRVILTGDDDSFKNLRKFYREEEILQKTPEGLEQAFQRFNYFLENSNDIQIREKYNEVFSLFQSGLYSTQDEETLLNVLQRSDLKEFAQFGGILRDIRALQESIYKSINIKNKSVVPDSFFKSNGMLDFNKLMRHLNGNPQVPGGSPVSVEFQNQAIFQLANTIYWTSGKYIHADPKEKYLISNYTVQALSYALLELYLWSKKYL